MHKRAKNVTFKIKKNLAKESELERNVRFTKLFKRNNTYKILK